MRKWGPLVAVCLGTFMLLLDVTIVVVALPPMADSLDASLPDLQWVVDGYALALAALLLAIGSLADSLGRRRIYLLGTALFAIASAACGLAPDAPTLIAARIVQGVGGAAMFATVLPLISATYRGKDRSVAFGIWGAVSGAAAAVGPIAGGLLTDGLDWRWIFFVNLPISVVAIAMTLRVVEESRNPHAQRVDIPGTLTFTVFASAAVYAMIEAGDTGWGSARTLVLFGVALMALAAFVVVELRVRQPMLDLALFRRPSFVGVMLAAFSLNAAGFAALAYSSLWLQTVLGMSPVAAGAVFLPLSGAAFVVAAAGGRLLHGVPARFTIGGGLLLIGAGAALPGIMGITVHWTTLVPGSVLIGLGVGLVAPAVSGAAIAAVPPERYGMASGALNTFRQLGYAFGVAVLGSVVVSRIQHVLTDAQVPQPDSVGRALASGAYRQIVAQVPATAREQAADTLHAAYASGLNFAWLIAGAVGIAAGLLALATIRSPAHQPGDQSGDQSRDRRAPATDAARPDPAPAA
jgi:EmrB/QacA subfamily drug resistance transporter